MRDASPDGQATGFEVAVIGMAGRFPKARDLAAFWRNIRDGTECRTVFSDEQLLAAGMEPALLSDPRFVSAGGVLDDPELFDAAFFGITPRDAEILDPQHRFFLECAWEALEDAGYDPEAYKGAIGVFAGTSRNTYLLVNLLREDLAARWDAAHMLASDGDYLTTRVSYKLNLRGPSVDVQTACSTSLVAVHLACQNLLAGECTMALAGGVSLRVPQEMGYLYQEGGILSPDGRCRAFDARAAGMFSANGVGIVVLKRLADALADGDAIRAIIKGSAMNNDGSVKVGFTAPSVDGQAQVIRRALALAEVHPDTVGYVEAHGTGTSLGDPIEIAGLTRAFRTRTARKGFCAIGSVKTNIGHTDAAAGVAGLIKALLALQHGVLPPSLHFERPNPNIDFENSPFYVNTSLRQWPRGETPRRAGVSSFGLGGTNAHVVLEEAPAPPPPGESRPWQLLVLSARTRDALENAAARLREHLRQRPGLDAADVAYTLQVGRKRFPHRRFAVCQDLADAVSTLEAGEPGRVLTGFEESKGRPVVFMFPGQGAQHVNMGRELYESEPGFRAQVDRCAEGLMPHLGRDLRRLLYPSGSEEASAADQLRQTSLTQPTLFVIEYALSQLWMSWGVKPVAMIGHSIGEYVAACLAGVFGLEDALALVARRGRLMQELPAGAMLSVPLPAAQVEVQLEAGVSVAALNEHAATVVSGPTEAVARLEGRLATQNVACQRLHTSHAFHSAMMDPILASFTECVRQVERRAPQIQYISNVTGSWVTAEQATDPGYWARHLREPVRFAQGLRELMNEPERVLLEVGPGRTLSGLASRQAGRGSRTVVVPSLRHPSEPQSDVAFLLRAVGQLWMAGVEVGWKGFHARGARQRVPLPTYPFERQRFWVEPHLTGQAGDARRDRGGKRPEIADWFYLPSWRRSEGPSLDSGLSKRGAWLVFADTSGLGDRLAQRLARAGQDVVSVVAAEEFAEQSAGVYALNPSKPGDYARLLDTLEAAGRTPATIAHLWGLDPPAAAGRAEDGARRVQELGFFSLIYLARALGERARDVRREILVVTSDVLDVTGEEALRPEQATVLGPCKVIPQEYSELTCRSIDLVAPGPRGWDEESVTQILAELASSSGDRVVAYRRGRRWVQSYDPWPLAAGEGRPRRLREGGVYFITGGLGGIGLEVAEFLARTVRAKLVLVGRSALPAPMDGERGRAAREDGGELGQRLRRLRTLEELGAEVLTLQADAANLEQMRSAVAEAEARFGAVHGVIHAAGAEGAFQSIVETGPSEAEAQFRPRLQGAAVLEQVLEGRPLDFCLLISSLSAVLGGRGSVAYTAAHVFLDTFVARHNRSSPVRWLSVNWDRWLTWREAASTLVSAEASYFMTPEEAQEALSRLLSRAAPAQLVVSTGDLEARIDRWIQLIVPEEARETEAYHPSLYARPELSRAYVEPRSPEERTLTGIWRDVLGLEKVGVNDDFFELGGDSVLGLKIVAKANEAGLLLKGRQIFEHPTIAELAAALAGSPLLPAARARDPQPPGPAVAEAPSAFAGARLDPKDLEALLAELHRARGKQPQ